MNEEDILNIASDLKDKGYEGTYYIQNYINNGGPTLGNLPEQKTSLPLSKIIEETAPLFQVSARNF